MSETSKVEALDVTGQGSRDKYVGRLAPSPTGPLHAGIVSSFLIAWLDARTQGGRIQLRIEDIDGPRTVAGAAESIQEDLEWLGLTWDDGPWFQSQRTSRYEAALERLQTLGRIFACSCSRKDLLLASSAPHGASGAIYPGTCRSGPTKPEAPTALRLRTRDKDCVEFEDLVHGKVSESVDTTTGDFVLRRSDGLFAYQLAVTVDDLEDGVTHIVRGRDLLGSTARQFLLRRILAPGALQPRTLHTPLLLNADHERLATRHGAPTVGAFREGGGRPKQYLSKVAQAVGLHSRGGGETTLSALVEHYARDAIPRTDQVF